MIDWVNGKNIIREFHLHNMLKAFDALQPTFEAVYFNHIYRKHNTEADTL